MSIVYGFFKDQFQHWLLAGGAVELEATFLYADLANSSRISKDLDRRVAARIMKSFLAITTRLIRSNDGSIVSFDGDRVLGVFVSESKNTNAAKCALQIAYVIKEIIRPNFEAKYDTIKSAGLHISHCVGIDTSKVLTVRAGARGDNDLIWIGRAPNLAAKLSELREPPYHSFVTASVYNSLNTRFGGKDKNKTWEKRSWKFIGDAITVYRSSSWWKL